MLGGLRAIAGLPGIARRILVYTGERRLVSPDGAEVWPVPTLLDALRRATLWP